LRLFTRALESSSQKEHQKSLVRLQAIYNLLEVEPPSERAPYFVNILLARVASLLEMYELSMAANKTALRQLDGTNKRLSDADKNYLRCYCSVVLEFCALKTNSQVFRESDSNHLAFKSLQLDKVRPHLKRNFPLKGSPRSEQQMPT
jgi:hypothetical protein